jgi:FtsH-binding integral membrane protein
VRSVVDFYRSRPVAGIIIFVIGLAVAVAVSTLHSGDGFVLLVAFTAAVGLVVGLAVSAVGQRRER